MGSKTVYFDVWGTLLNPINASETSKILESLLGNDSSLKKDFFVEWKNFWFKKDEKIENFVSHLSKKFSFSYSKENKIRSAIDIYFSDVRIYPSVDRVMRDLHSQNYRLGIISDCGSDTKKLLEDIGLSKKFDEIHYSYDYGCVKEDGLYEKVFERKSRKNIFMVGDDKKRDYDIPFSRGVNSFLIDREGNFVGIYNRISELTKLPRKLSGK